MASRRSIMTLFSAPDEPQSHRVRMVLADSSGKSRHFLVSSAPIVDESERLRGAVVSFDDVTQLEEANVALGGAAWPAELFVWTCPSQEALLRVVLALEQLAGRSTHRPARRFGHVSATRCFE